MRPMAHVTASFASSLVIYSWFKSPLAAIICFLGGIFIDLDHVPEYFSANNKELSLKALYYSNIVKDKERIYIVFHSFDLIFLLWLAVLFLELNLFWVALAIGATIHLILDLLTNPIASVYTYFFTYRLAKQFKAKDLFTGVRR